MAGVTTRSLGLRTDLMLIGWDGVVDAFEGAVRARSPGNPSFFFGNFLLHPDAPVAADVEAWIARFGAAFADDPRVRHVCLRWDRPDGARGAADALVAAGFTLEETVVLVTGTPHPPPRVNHEAALRRIETDAAWDAVVAAQVATMVAEHGAGGEAYARRQMDRYRRFVAAGRGAWFGAFVDGQLAADMGVFVEHGLGRFQAVETAAAFRRRGLCGTLAYHVAQVALAELGVSELVLVGLPDHTSAIYASIGFVERERLVAAFRPGP